MFLAVSIILGTLAGMTTTFSRKTSVMVGPNTILSIGLEAGLGEQCKKNPLENLVPCNLIQSSGVGLLSLIRSIEAAALDPSIKLIYLHPQYMQAGISQAEDFRSALKKFREAGKAVVAYADSYSQLSYYCVSMADRIILNPEGVVSINGMSANIRYYKDLFDKLGIEVQVVKQGRYKGAAEQYTDSRMSSRQREEIRSYLDDIWHHWLAGIEADREIDAAEMNRMADELSLVSARDALQAGLVDALLYKDQVIDYLCSLANVKTERDLKVIGIEDYARARIRPDYKVKDKIALLYAQGDIITGKGNEDICSDTYAAQIRQLRADSTVKAVVLRLDSPGGDPLAAAILARELKLLADSKPLVVSMGDYATSGGYWIAAASQHIFASPVSLTGSIGAYSLAFNAEKGATKLLGIRPESVSTNRYSNQGNLLHSMEPPLLEYLQKRIDLVYDSFTRWVGGQRAIEADTLYRVAQGRVFSGLRARDLHLTDRTGGLGDALSQAAMLANLTEYRIEEYPREMSFINRILEKFENSRALLAMNKKVKVSLPFVIEWCW